MSKANDFYPGTTERVCLIIGTLKACMQLNNYIMKKIAERPEPTFPVVNHSVTSTGTVPISTARHNQVKILVPDSTAGVIIGKSGSYIKKIKEKSGALVQISQRPKELKLMERCIVVTGEFETRQTAMSMILEKIAEDPDSASYPNCSYTQVHEPVASAFPTGSPFAVGQKEMVIASPCMSLSCSSDTNTNGTHELAHQQQDAQLLHSPVILGMPTSIHQNMSSPAEFQSTTPAYHDPQSFFMRGDDQSTNMPISPCPATLTALSALRPPTFSVSNFVPYANSMCPSSTASFPMTWFPDASSGVSSLPSRPNATVLPSDLVFAPCGPIFPTIYNDPTIAALQASDLAAHHCFLLFNALSNYGLMDPYMLNYYGQQPFGSLTSATSGEQPSTCLLYPQGSVAACLNYDDCTTRQEFMSPCLANESLTHVVSPHARCWSGGSTDSALTDSLTSVRLQSSFDDRLVNPLQTPSSTQPQSCPPRTTDLPWIPGSTNIVQRGDEGEFVGHTPFIPPFVQAAPFSSIGPPGSLQSGLCISSEVNLQNPWQFGHLSVPQVSTLYNSATFNMHPSSGLLLPRCVNPMNTSIGNSISPNGLLPFIGPIGSCSQLSNLEDIAHSYTIRNLMCLPNSPKIPYPDISHTPNGPLIRLPALSDYSALKSRYCFNETSDSASSGGVLLVGTAQQIQKTLTAMRLPFRSVPTTSSVVGSGPTVLPLPCNDTLGPSQPQASASFLQDTPLRVDRIQFLCRPSCLSATCATSQTTLSTNTRTVDAS
ncbi:hypothetical protein EG68_10219 [Paragonimus skrjabini miyazakii]|uniref:K Homology domain-containing protein n=1 Tax=Paragonimus skrjabini miyazakii TaxID=59628 RepID=A0A8S9YF47_9TREM|nr:hypothetical protein EG68_10219 [Paragonimus skrjabini miyazakii]